MQKILTVILKGKTLIKNPEYVILYNLIGLLIKALGNMRKQKKILNGLKLDNKILH